MSYLEIYNEQLYDLLGDSPGTSDSMAVLEDANGNTYVRAYGREGVGLGAAGGKGLRGGILGASVPLEHPLSQLRHRQWDHLKLYRTSGQSLARVSSPWSKAQGRLTDSTLLAYNHFRSACNPRPPAHQVRGLTLVPVASEEEALAQFFLGEQGRTTAGHVLNAESSRSHTVFTIHLEVGGGRRGRGLRAVWGWRWAGGGGGAGSRGPGAYHRGNTVAMGTWKGIAVLLSISGCVP